MRIFCFIIALIQALFFATVASGTTDSASSSTNTKFEEFFQTPDSCAGFRVDEECVSKDSFIKIVQSQLNSVGCSIGAVDGVIGPKTRSWIASLESMWRDKSFDDMMAANQPDDILARIQIMGEQVCQSAYKLSADCRTAYKEWKSRPGAGAFVASAAGGCTTSSGYASKSSASSAAMATCRKAGFPCKVLETKKPVSAASRCNAQLPDYKRSKKHKAIALGGGVCYLVTGAITKSKAQRNALSYCKRKGGTNCQIVRSE